MSRNKLLPRTAGQGVSESSLAGFLHTGSRDIQKMFKRQEHKYGLSEGTCHVSMFVFLKLDQKIKIIKKNKKNKQDAASACRSVRASV